VSLPPFPNVELLLRDDLNALADGAWEAGGVTPADLQDRVPFVEVRRAGGASDRVNDYAAVELHVWAATYAAAADVAEQIRAHLLDGHIRNSHGQIDRAVCTSAHTEIPSPDPTLRRLVTGYRVTCRRLAAPA
jgi:hypothetical protein